MNRTQLITLLVLYGLSILVYIIHSARRHTKMVLLPVFVFLPLIGPAALILIAFGGLFKKKKDIEVFDEDEKKQKYEYLTQINDEKEMNIVPMKEAMALNKTSTQRDIVFELAKGDPNEYIKNLKQALLSEDSEVAHYAASSISKFKREMEKTLAERETEFSDRPELSKNRNALINALNDGIKAGLATNEEIQQMENRIIEILMMEIRLGEAVTKEHYNMICAYLLKTEDYPHFQNWMKEFQVKFPTADEILRLKLQYAYRMKDTALFKQVMSEAEGASYVITKETLNMIQFWNQGAK